MSAAPRLIEHIGILVDDLESAISKWTRILGYSFGPICRYRTSTWIDSSDTTPHFHDARIAFSNEGPPRIELMEVTGAGTHSLRERGFHHFGFVAVEDTEALRQEFMAAGVRTDGAALNESGHAILWFTNKDELNGIRLEYVGTEQQPVVRDDGRPIHFDENGNPDFTALADN